MELSLYINPFIYLFLAGVFIARLLKNIKLESFSGWASIAFGGVSGVSGILSAVTSLEINLPSLIASSLLLIWAIIALIFDVIRKVEFRDPPKPAILVPYLVTLFLGLAINWVLAWEVNIVLWASNMVLLIAMVCLMIFSHLKGSL